MSARNTSDSGTPSVGATSLQSRVRALRDELTTGLVEREEAIRLALLAALAGEHLLLLGPPGTAKSLVARRLHLAFERSSYFERLLTRFSVPEELFGPLSIRGLEQDRYERLTEGYLPTASIAFLDEIFKANSAILNTLLTLLNEREFDNGVERQPTPLVAVIGASNELPKKESLGALYDRFLLRLDVGAVSDGSFLDLLRLRGEVQASIPETLRISATELNAIAQAAQQVEVPADVVTLLCDLRDACDAENLPVSDRRWRKVVKLLQVSAWTNGREQVSIWDCWLVQHCLWEQPEDREKVYDLYVAKVGERAEMTPGQLLRIVDSWEGKLELERGRSEQLRDREGRPRFHQKRDSEGRPLFEKLNGELTTSRRGHVWRTRDEQPLYLAPVRRRAHPGHEMGRFPDRTDGGRGYTLKELDRIELYQEDFSYEMWIRFESWSGRAQYLANPENWFTQIGDLEPLMVPTLHEHLYVETCLTQLDRHLDELDTYRETLRCQIASLTEDIAAHLWVDDVFIGPASAGLARTLEVVSSLETRLKRVRAGFSNLPTDGAHTRGRTSR